MPVRVRRDILGIKGDECDCGRRASILHCNACGSTRVYARINRQHTFLDGHSAFVETQYRCQTCGHVFIAEERQFCDAPPVSEALARLKIQRLALAVEQGEYLRPTDAEAAQAVTELLKQPNAPASNDELPVEEVPIEEMPVFEPSSTETYPNGLTREEYIQAKNVFVSEWVETRRLVGTTPTKTVEEYVKRRFNGEVLL